MDTKNQHDNLVCQIILHAIMADGVAYLDTDDAKYWLELIDMDANVLREALAVTGGKINDIRYINERLDD